MKETTARLNLWETHGAIKAATQNELATKRTELGRLFRKGLTVAAFNALEGFILERWEEVTHSLESNREKTLTFANLSPQKKEDLLKHHMALLISKIPRFDDRLKEFIATSEVLNPQTNTLFPKSTFMPEGSNISTKSLNTSFSLYGISNPWEQMNTLLTFTFTNANQVEIKKRFESFFDMRNQCAHNSTTLADVSLFRSVPSFLISLSYGFDILISLFGRHLLNANSISDLDDKRIENLIAQSSWIRANIEPSSGIIELYCLSRSDRTPNSMNQIASLQIDPFDETAEITLNTVYSDNSDLLNEVTDIANMNNISFITFFSTHSSELLGWSTLSI